MTISELSKRYKICTEKLKYFSDNELINIGTKCDEKDEKKLGMLCSLYDVGFNSTEMKQFIAFENTENRQEQIKLLGKHRAALLESIHAKQKLLDQIDYIMYQIKKEALSN